MFFTKLEINMSNLAKKYLVPVLLIVILAGYFLMTRNSDQISVTPKPQTASEKTEQTTKVEGRENTDQSSNPAADNSQTKTQSKVQGSSSQKTNSSTSQSNGSTNEAGTPVGEVTLNIDAGASTYSYKVEWSEGMTVWDILKNAASKNGFDVKYDDKTYKDWGVFVQGIHGNNCECWNYKLNDKCPLGVSKTYTSKGDSILFSVNHIC